MYTYLSEYIFVLCSVTDEAKKKVQPQTDGLRMAEGQVWREGGREGGREGEMEGGREGGRGEGGIQGREGGRDRGEGGRESE